MVVCETEKMTEKAEKAPSCLDLALYWVVQIVHINFLHVIFFLRTASQKLRTYINYFIFS